MCSHDPLQCILPPHILRKIAESSDAELRAAALATLELDHKFRLARAESAARRGGRALRPITLARTGGKPRRTIYDAHHAKPQTPHDVARAEGQPAVADLAVNQAYDGLGFTYRYYWSAFQRDSIDGAGEPLNGVVHYGRDYDNAFWDNAGHMWFGDGSGRIFKQTTAGIDVIAHELTHGITQNEANLDYSGESGALNESVSDVFGIQVKQMALGQDVLASDWLIGADIVGPELAPALRSMKAPGSANKYDDQPADMDGYVDGGDVHTNSGIPNRAFYLVASALGGHSWDAAGPIWYAALCDPQLRSDASFTEFADLTAVHAERRCGAGSKEVDAVVSAWETVKVPVHHAAATTAAAARVAVGMAAGAAGR
jgi:Zn-dependent metalloprotease